MLFLLPFLLWYGRPLQPVIGQEFETNNVPSSIVAMESQTVPSLRLNVDVNDFCMKVYLIQRYHVMGIPAP